MLAAQIAAQAVLPEPRSDYGRLRNYVGGVWRESASSRTRDVVNPATGKAIAQVPLSTTEEVNEAVSVAKEAFEKWRSVSPVKRARPFFMLKHLLETNREEIARTLVQEMGKTILEARAEMTRAIEEVECACGIPSLTKGDFTQQLAAGLDLRLAHVPLGVFFMVPAFNFPAMVPLEYLPYAVGCGNTYIVKPASPVPLTQVRIFELIDECGFPPGVINLVHGSRDVVSDLLENPDTRGFSLVGSTPVGHDLYARAAQLGKRAQCATGAKNHFVVMPDADLDRTVKAIMDSFFGCAGQRCLAGAVLVPVGEIGDPLVERLTEAASKVRLGYGLDETAQLGPVVTQGAKERIVGYIEQGVQEGAELLLDGRGVVVDGYPDGAFVGPTVFDRVTPSMTIAREEIFGPVLSTIRVENLEEAILLTKASRFGHSAMIYTADGNAARRFEYEVECGNVGVNVGIAATQSFSTLGGLKASGYGDLHGRSESVLFFTDRKIIVSRWDSA